MKRFLNGIVAPFFAFWWILLTALTLRVTRRGEEETEFYMRENPYIAVFWHIRIFYMTWLFSWRRKMNALVSPSVDGDIIANSLRFFGYGLVR